MKTFIAALVGIMTLVNNASARSTYGLLIPNGRAVPSPCESNSTWYGVGHRAPGGRGPGNPFGHDFYGAGHKWTAELCRKDSDGDGTPNGAELGDPNCVWVNSTTPVAGPATGHPGVCEPVWSDDCKAKQTWLTESNCAFIKNPPTTPAPIVAATDATTVAPQLGWTDVQSGCYCTCLRLPAGSAPWDHHDDDDDNDEKRRRRRDADRDNHNPMAQFGPPPVASSTQFNDTTYAVQMPCYCACPKR